MCSLEPSPRPDGPVTGGQGGGGEQGRGRGGGLGGRRGMPRGCGQGRGWAEQGGGRRAGQGGATGQGRGGQVEGLGPEREARSRACAASAPCQRDSAWSALSVHMERTIRHRQQCHAGPGGGPASHRVTAAASRGERRASGARTVPEGRLVVCAECGAYPGTSGTVNMRGGGGPRAGGRAPWHVHAVGSGLNIFGSRLVSQCFLVALPASSSAKHPPGGNYSGVAKIVPES
jgi:hypothetical protein